MNKPTFLETDVWASGQTLGEHIINPDDTYKALGWVFGTKPPYSVVNWIQRTHDETLVHLNQTGIMSWDTDTLYATNAYVNLKRKGATIITKKECKLNPNKIKGFLKKISTSHVYVSIDMDIGANNALEGVRFRNWQGLNEVQIYKLADAVTEIFSGSVQLAGMDVCEIDPRRAGTMASSGNDKTYEIAANLIKKIAFSKERENN